MSPEVAPPLSLDVGPSAGALGGPPASSWTLEGVAWPGYRAHAARVARTSAPGWIASRRPRRRGYWNRSNTMEVHIPIAWDVTFLGSVKWLEQSPFDSHDLAILQRHRAALTDDPIPLVGVSRSGVVADGLAASYGPAELLRAAFRLTSTAGRPLAEKRIDHILNAPTHRSPRRVLVAPGGHRAAIGRQRLKLA